MCPHTMPVTDPLLYMIYVDHGLLTDRIRTGQGGRLDCVFTALLMIGASETDHTDVPSIDDGFPNR